MDPDGWLGPPWHFENSHRLLVMKALGTRRHVSAIHETEEAVRLFLALQAEEGVERELSRLPGMKAIARIYRSFPHLAQERDLKRDRALNTLPAEARQAIGEAPRESAFRKGRPPKEALGVLINLLALIWERARGEWPTRTWDEYRGRERGAFLAFVDVVLAALPGHSGPPTGVFRKVLRGRRIVQQQNDGQRSRRGVRSRLR